MEEIESVSASGDGNDEETVDKEIDERLETSDVTTTVMEIKQEFDESQIL